MGAFTLQKKLKNKKLYLQQKIDYKRLHDYKIQTRYEASINDINFLKSGDERVTLIYQIFYDGLGLIWSPIQQKCFVEVVNAALPLIYGTYWNTEKTRVLFERKLQKIQQEVLLNLPRRNGKTFVTAAITTCFLIVIDGISICIFSVSERQSKMLKKTVDQFVKKVWLVGKYSKEEDFSKIESNKETWCYIKIKTNSEQKLSALPSTSDVSSFSFYFFMCVKVKNVFRLVSR